MSALTDSELLEIDNSTISTINKIIDNIKSVRDGQYPIDWFEKVLNVKRGPYRYYDKETPFEIVSIKKL